MIMFLTTPRFMN